MEERRRRLEMVRTQIEARGIADRDVLDAIRSIPRERFVDDELAEFAYRDAPLPIAEGQTISQPYIVALLAEAARLEPKDRVLEIGTGSGYQAAVLSRLVHEVITVERHESLAALAREHLDELGIDNVEVLLANGTLGVPHRAPFDAIVVTAGGPGVPQSLLDQLAIGGRLVMPVGDDPHEQVLTRFWRVGERRFEREELCAVRFVPLIGAEGWSEASLDASTRAKRRHATPLDELTAIVREAARPFEDLETMELGPLLEQLGDAHVVLLGAATDGTSEHDRLRARITKELMLRKGFDVVALETDWSDAERIDRYVRGRERSSRPGRAFARFPTWTWKNEEFLEFIEWVRGFNEEFPENRTGFFGLDLYGHYTSTSAILHHLDDVDPKSAQRARDRYGLLSPWLSDPDTYARAALTGEYTRAGDALASMLRTRLEAQLESTAADDDDGLFDPSRNVDLLTRAEDHYAALFLGGERAWNLRETHMFETLEHVLATRRARGIPSKAVVWAHDAHAGDLRATELGVRGEVSLGQRARERWGDAAYLVGLGTHHGTLCAAAAWDGPRERMTLAPAAHDTYEHLMHRTGLPAFQLDLRDPRTEALRPALGLPRRERAIGAVYRPDRERDSHTFEASLPQQFDTWLWLDETEAVHPLDHIQKSDQPDTYPFGL
ncbi:protein-L-isoaspartate(D-aspartate) O-methyltransferase [Myxococcota bacterium]|nr:protein-L-isoaspartate(D-aspartate) O-methyltransferase [Myxococcota bacterium]